MTRWVSPTDACEHGYPNGVGCHDCGGPHPGGAVVVIVTVGAVLAVLAVGGAFMLGRWVGTWDWGAWL